MINLIPPETKKSYYYAQSNQKMLKWVTSLVIGLIGIGIIGTYGWISLHQAISKHKSQVSQIQASLNRNNLLGTNSKIATISNDFNLVVKVLSQEVVFSKLLSSMAAALPAGTNLTGLNITTTSSGSGLDITAEATNYNLASQVQVNLADPANGIFSKADIVSITCIPNPQTNPLYPCTVSLRAQFAPNNQFLFINQKVAKP